MKKEKRTIVVDEAIQDTSESWIEDWKDRSQYYIIPEEILEDITKSITRYISKAKAEEREETIKEWNCKCGYPDPDGNHCIPSFGEGNYQRCKMCDRRIWS